jgi:hypothetical protein
MGLAQPPARSTLADALNMRDWRIYEALALRLISRARALWLQPYDFKNRTLHVRSAKFDVLTQSRTGVFPPRMRTESSGGRVREKLASAFAQQAAAQLAPPASLGGRPHIFEAARAETLDPGNSFCRSLARRSMTLVPHPSACCRLRISRPIDQ